MSILKPVAGCDEGLAANLASFVDLDYPAYELLIGVTSLDDPAVPVVEAFLAAHPALQATLVVTSPPRGEIRNPKVAQLVGLARAARGALLVVSDANIRVPRSYLRSLVAALLRPGVGLVSSLIVSAEEHTLAAAIDGAQLGAYVAPSIVTAHRLGLWPITVGKSMAMRRADLARIGGFECVGGVLAEDDVLGQRFAAMGHGVELCLDPVENHSGHASWQTTLDRHARWAMIRRSITPLGFAFELLLSPLLVAAAAFAITRSPVALSALGGSLVLSWVGAYLSLSRVRGRGALWLASLEPLRVAAMSLCWCLGVVRRRVIWRGNDFLIASGSRLLPTSKGDAPAVATRLLGRLGTLARSLITGGAATLADLAVLALAVGALHASPRAASLPALLVGAGVQFFGNRHFAFRAAAGRIGRQALLFIAAEAVAMTLNAVLYHLVAAWIPLALTAAVCARVCTTGLVYLLWSYPVWRHVFSTPNGGAALAD